MAERADVSAEAFQETLMPTAGGPSQEDHGNYVMILKLQADGHWRIVEHVWTMVGNAVLPIPK